MAQLIKQGAVTVDTWKTLELNEGETPENVALPEGNLIVPLPVWQARQSELLNRSTLGLLIQPGEAIEDVAADLAHFQVIAVNFPKFVDGRGYSTASLLRQRYGFQGEVRAVGDVLHDQLFFMQRVGFDAFALKEGKDAAYALSHGYVTFGETYQGATTEPNPYFRRRA